MDDEDENPFCTRCGEELFGFENGPMCDRCTYRDDEVEGYDDEP
jgi:tRNA(Ile2) C34 agmatinyltransferase TiaS